MSKDEKLAATGGEDDKAFVWDTVSGDIILECTGHKDSVTFSDFNHDDSYLATGDMGGLIQVWKMSDKNSVWNYEMDDMTVRKDFFQTFKYIFETNILRVKILFTLVDAVAFGS